MTNLLYSDRKEAAELKIRQLGAKRTAIANSHEKLRLALEKLTGEPPALGDVHLYINLPTSEAAEEMALKEWVDKQPHQINFKNKPLRDSLEIPKEVERVVKAYSELVRSERIADYWSDKERNFQRMPVFDEEKEKIREREKLYVNTEERKEQYEFLLNLVRFINQANTFPGFSEIPIHKIRESYPWMMPFIKIEPNRIDRGIPRYFVQIKEDLFISKGSDYKAFDE